MNFQRRKILVGVLPSPVRHKWGDAALDEGFVPYPKRLLRTARLIFKGNRRLRELSAFLAIVDFNREGIDRLPSLAYLAYLAGLRPGSFRKCLSDFTERGWVTVSGTENNINIDYSGLLKVIQEISDKQDKPKQADGLKVKVIRKESPEQLVKIISKGPRGKPIVKWKKQGRDHR